MPDRYSSPDPAAEGTEVRAREALIAEFPELGPGRGRERGPSEEGVERRELSVSRDAGDRTTELTSPTAAPPDVENSRSFAAVAPTPAEHPHAVRLGPPRPLSVTEFGSIGLALLLVALPGLLIVAPDEWLISHHLLHFRDGHPLLMSAGLFFGTCGGGMLLWHFRTSDARAAYNARRQANKARRLERVFANLVHAEKDGLARLCEQEMIDFGSTDHELGVAMNGLYQHGLVEIERLAPGGLRARLRPRRRDAALGWWMNSEFRRAEPVAAEPAQ